MLKRKSSQFDWIFYYHVLWLLSGGCSGFGADDANANRLASDAVYDDPVAYKLISGIDAIK